MRALTLLMVAVAACGGGDDKGGTAQTDDADGDGVLTADDCDDTDDSVGLPSTFYIDADGDGFGDAAATVEACEAPDGAVDDGTDCDDTNADVSPAGQEVCDADGIDEDCDGAVNSADDDADGEIAWYPDVDGDGYGDPAGQVTSCDDPGGYIADGTDCDDTNDWAFPGNPEICDGADNDCDASTPEDGMVTLDGLTNHTTITEAIEAAEIGSVISVCAGTYEENLDIVSSLSIYGVAGAEATIIDVGGVGSPVAVAAGEVEIAGFTLTGGIGSGEDGGTQRGGGILARDADALTVEDCIVTDNSADYGGGVYGSVDGTTVITATTISDNQAEASGGGLYMVNGTLDTLTIDGNDAAYGGGLYVAEGIVDGADIVLTDNEGEYGGGVYLGGSTLSGVHAEGNTAERGGGLYLRNDATLTGATVTGNEAVNYGGGIMVYGGGAIEDATVDANTANLGGGILADGEDLLLTDVTIEGNTGESAAGGLYAYELDVDLESVLISGNASVAGAGIYAQDAALFGDGSCEISTNIASENGGGIYVGTSGGEIDEFVILDNEATDGGGVHVRGEAFLYALELSGNAATSQGGALYTGYDVSLEASVLDANEAVYGGGIYVTNSAAVTVEDSSVTANLAESFGGGARVISGTLSSVSTDWGDKTNDNDPDDVAVGYSTRNDLSGLEGDFTCDADAATCE